MSKYKNNIFTLGKIDIPPIHKLDIFNISNINRNLSTDIESYIKNKYKNARLIEKDEYEYVYEFRFSDGSSRVIKVLKYSNSDSDMDIVNYTVRELYVQDLFYRMNLAPKIYSAEIVSNLYDKYSIIETEKIDGNLQYLLNNTTVGEQSIIDIFKQISEMMIIYRKNGYMYGNLSLTNIEYKFVESNKIRLYLTGFDYACCVSNIIQNKDSYVYNIAQLLTSSYYTYENSNNAPIIKNITNSIHEMLADKITELGDKSVGYDILLNYIDRLKVSPNMINKNLYIEIQGDLRESYEKYLKMDLDNIKKVNFDMFGNEIIYRYQPQIIDLKNMSTRTQSQITDFRNKNILAITQ